MSYQVIVKPEAEVDILESFKWYEKQKEGLGSRFLQSLEEKIGLLRANPKQYQKRHKEIRFAFIDKFPYAIHFLVQDDMVYILAVLSTHRDPEIWRTG